MRDVAPLARLAEAVALDRPREDDGRLAVRLAGGLERGVDLDRVVPANRSFSICSSVISATRAARRGVGPEEAIARIRPGLDRVHLPLPVDGLVHALDEDAVGIRREERVPVLAPQHLDDVPAGAAEGAFEFLDDVAIAANRAVETLQVAVDHENEVVEFLPGRQRDGTERLGLVHLAVAEEGPDA